jgi:hypothetical protein
MDAKYDEKVGKIKINQLLFDIEYNDDNVV